MKYLCGTVNTKAILTNKQLFDCLGMLYYSEFSGIKGIIIKIIGVGNGIFFYEFLTPNLKIEKKSTSINFLEIREL